MANTDRSNGFKPVKTFSGAPVSGIVRYVGVTDAADLFVGDALTLTSGLAARSNDCIFEVQTATALTLAIGGQCDLSAGSGNTTTGISDMELTTDSNHDIEVVEVKKSPDNDETLVNGRYWVKFITTEQAFHA